MLVLGRKEGEKIMIDNGRIVVTIVEIRPGHVRIGVDAPKEVPVYREEVQRLIDGNDKRRTSSPIQGTSSETKPESKR